MSFVSAATTTLVLDPNGGETLNRSTMSPYGIDFNITGSDKNTLLIDINFSTSGSQGTGTVIVNDLNTSSASITCVGNDFNQAGKTCTYFWNLGGIPNGSYFILVDANSVNAASFDASNASFTVTSFYSKTYSGADIGTIFIDFFGIILTTLSRNISAIVILLIIGIMGVFFREDLSKILDIFKRF